MQPLLIPAGLRVRAEEVAEKRWILGKLVESVPPGLKPALHLLTFCGG
jgi:hypothetical protein